MCAGRYATQPRFGVLDTYFLLYMMHWPFTRPVPFFPWLFPEYREHCGFTTISHNWLQSWNSETLPRWGPVRLCMHLSRVWFNVPLNIFDD